MTQDEIAKVAGELTQAQKGLVLMLYGAWSFPKVSPATTSHRDEQLIQRRGAASCSPYRLTPLGIAVRDFLRGEDHGAS